MIELYPNMLYRCEYCGKGAMVGHTVSHAKNRSRRIALPNLHYKTVVVSGGKVRMRLCTRCIRLLGSKEKPVEAARPQA